VQLAGDGLGDVMVRETGVACPGRVHTFDRWAASYDLSQLQTALYGPVHDAVLRYARQHVLRPARILDVGCGTGRLLTRIASLYRQAHVVGVDASSEMIKNATVTAVTAPAVRPARFASAAAGQLPFADGLFDLAVVTLSVSHWGDKAAGLAEMSRVMAPDATLVAADVLPAPLSHYMTIQGRRRKLAPSHELPSLIAASGLRVEHVEPIGSVTLVANAVLIAAQKPC
jgi:ubiquinone/menaquinone biosynthesis C-methylase UbiE